MRDLLNPIAADEAELARRQAAAPLKPRAEQAACDVGLFSDSAQQVDLVDLARHKKQATARAARLLVTFAAAKLNR